MNIRVFDSCAYVSTAPGWRIFVRARDQIVYELRRNPVRVHGNFEKQNKDLEYSIIYY